MAVPLVGLVSAPLGHLLAYQVRYRPQALHQQSAGAHAYFLVLVGTVAAAIGGALLVSVLSLAAVRLLVGRHRGMHAGGGWSMWDLLPVLFVLQLAVFMAQETAEALASASAVEPIPELMLWGTLGQLPIALLAAIGLSRLTARLDAALRYVRAAAESFADRPTFAVRVWPAAVAWHPALDCARRAHGDRGPPSLWLTPGR
jgi:hypothetical protein